MTNKNIFFKIISVMFVSVLVFVYSAFPAIGAEIESLNEKDYTYVVAEGENKNASQKEGEVSSNAPKDKQNNKKGSSNSWDVAFWVGSAGCLVLAVILAIRSGNKKYGKD